MCTIVSIQQKSALSANQYQTWRNSLITGSELVDKRVALVDWTLLCASNAAICTVLSSLKGRLGVKRIDLPSVEVRSDLCRISSSLVSSTHMACKLHILHRLLDQNKISRVLFIIDFQSYCYCPKRCLIEPSPREQGMYWWLEYSDSIMALSCLNSWHKILRTGWWCAINASL